MFIVNAVLIDLAVEIESLNFFKSAQLIILLILPDRVGVCAYLSTARGRSRGIGIGCQFPSGAH